MKFPLLFSEGFIGSMKLKNRLIMAPMGTHYGAENEVITDRQLRHYERRAEGGIGLIITGSCPVEEKGSHGPGRILVYRKDSVARLKVLTGAVHKYDCKIVLQLSHGGAKCSPGLIGEYPVAPSSITIPGKDFIPKTLSTAEIEAIIAKFGQAAVVGQKADFDGIQLLAASGHLIHQFLSPETNKRSDRYGGSLENRMRFLIEIVQQIQTVTRGSLPILVKLLGKDPGNPKGTAWPEDDVVATAKMLAEKGVSCLHLSTNYALNPSGERDTLLGIAKRIKQDADVRVSMAGSFFQATEAERTLREASVDFIEIGRQLLAEPDLANNLISGHEEEIRPCLDCNFCRHKIVLKQPIKCVVNPFLGQEGLKEVAKAKKHKNISIIGGGPAGLQAAIQLARRGHTGTIYEREQVLGGLLWAGSIAPGKEKIKLFLDYLLFQFEKTGFRVATGTEVTTQTMESLNLDQADAVIIANGAVPFVPKQLRQNQNNVFMATPILSRQVSVEGKIIILGGGQTGCETADFLSENENCEITIMATSPTVAKHIHRHERIPVLQRLGEKGVSILVNASLLKFNRHNLSYLHNGKAKTMAFDALVIAKGWKENHSLKQELEGRWGKPIYLIGDAYSPRSIREAMEEGTHAAEEISQMS